MKQEDMKPPKKYPFKPYGDTWWEDASKIALSQCPPFIACEKCGAPVVAGYACTYCGTTVPR